MKLKLKEDPKEWRKATVLSATGLAILITLLRWRHILSLTAWIIALVLLASVILAACFSPRWFRGYYRISSRVGFALSQGLGYILLVVFFFLVLTPLGLVMKLCGKDLLGLKRDRTATTYWNPTRPGGPLDRPF